MEYTEIKYMDIKEFREFGFLQEVNRQFFHPLGLALAIQMSETGEESLGGVWDCRDDPEGMEYGEGMINPNKVLRVQALLNSKKDIRTLKFGSTIQG